MKDIATNRALFDLNLIKYNPELKEDTIRSVYGKIESVKQTLYSYFENMPDKDVFILPLFSICTRTLEQPVYVLDAMKFQSKIDQEKYINDNIGFALDKFSLFNSVLKKAFNEALARGANQKALRNIFIFTEQFINELRTGFPININYIESELFKKYFEEVISYKNLYKSVFGDFSFSNIESIQKQFKNNNTPIHQLKDTLEKACGGVASPEYISIKKWFITTGLINPQTLHYIDRKSGYQKTLARMLKDISVKGYSETLSVSEIIEIAKNTFGVKIGKSTIDHSQPESNIPPFHS